MNKKYLIIGGSVITFIIVIVILSFVFKKENGDGYNDEIEDDAEINPTYTKAEYLVLVSRIKEAMNSWSHYNTDEDEINAVMDLLFNPSDWANLVIEFGVWDVGSGKKMNLKDALIYELDSKEMGTVRAKLLNIDVRI